jgi:hypothetical protein
MLLLIHDPEPDKPRRRPLPHIPWRPFAWVAAFCWLLLLAVQVGGFAGYLLVLLAVGVGSWRIDRWLSKQYWGGLTEWHG